MGLFLVKSLTTVGWAVIHVWSHLSSFIVHTRALLGIQLKNKNTEKMLVESMEMNVCKFDSFVPRTTYLFLDFGNLVVTP